MTYAASIQAEMPKSFTEIITSSFINVSKSSDNMAENQLYKASSSAHTTCIVTHRWTLYLHFSAQKWRHISADTLCADRKLTRFGNCAGPAY